MAKSAMTRPRISSRLSSCKVAFDVATKAIETAPIGTSRTTATATDGASATPAMSRPKAAQSPVSRANEGLERWATVKPPITAPMPIAPIRTP